MSEPVFAIGSIVQIDKCLGSFHQGHVGHVDSVIFSDGKPLYCIKGVPGRWVSETLTLISGPCFEYTDAGVDDVPPPLEAMSCVEALEHTHTQRVISEAHPNAHTVANGVCIGDIVQQKKPGFERRYYRVSGIRVFGKELVFDDATPQEEECLSPEALVLGDTSVEKVKLLAKEAALAKYKAKEKELAIAAATAAYALQKHRATRHQLMATHQ